MLASRVVTPSVSVSIRRVSASVLASGPSRPSAASPRFFSVTPAARADFTHAVIGGGVVGLAVAHQLAQRISSSATPSAPASVVVIERHAAVGTETSSRSSEVVHGGFYYGTTSLKARTCVRGRTLLYKLCRKRGIDHRVIGKWIVAQTPAQWDVLKKLRATAAALEIPVRYAPGKLLQREESDYGVVARMGALECPVTGIVDSHGLVTCLHGLLQDVGGTVALRSAVVAVRPLATTTTAVDLDQSRDGDGKLSASGDAAAAAASASSTSPRGEAGWAIDVRDTDTGAITTITADTIVNAAGLGAGDIHNMIVDATTKPSSSKTKTKTTTTTPRITLHFAKGNYYSYTPHRTHPRPKRLIYPVPVPDGTGLGIHLTLDLQGRIRFGPDVEWVHRADDLAVQTSAARLTAVKYAIHSYLPGVDEASIAPDYAGIRPKLSRPTFTGIRPKWMVSGGKKDDKKDDKKDGDGKKVGSGKKETIRLVADDFIIRLEPGYVGWVNLLGIESPGLTSSLAIAEMVEEIFYGDSRELF